MKIFNELVAVLLAVAPVFSSPIIHTNSAVKRATNDNITDELLLNFVLSMQITEYSYYTTALNLYNTSAFVAAGVPSWARGRLLQILDHEQFHINKFRDILGSAAQEAPCQYEWPYHDPYTFILLSQILEGLNAGALIKLLPFVQDKTLLPVFANLIATESRHASWLGSASGKVMPWSGPWETPATFGQYATQLAVHTLTCPATNYKLPFKKFQMLMSVPYCHGCVLTPGQQLQLNFTKIPELPPPYYAAFMVGMNTTFVPIVPGNLTALPENDPMGNDTFTGVTQIPPYVQGDVYIMAVNSNTSVSDDNTLAGAFLFQVPFPSSATNNDLKK